VREERLSAQLEAKIALAGHMGFFSLQMTPNKANARCPSILADCERCSLNYGVLGIAYDEK
jgi:hypothetical protein